MDIIETGKDIQPDLSSMHPKKVKAIQLFDAFNAWLRTKFMFFSLGEKTKPVRPGNTFRNLLIEF